MPQGVQVRPLLPAPRQKKPTALRFRRGGESSVSVGSFFLSKPGVSRGTPGLVMEDDMESPFSGAGDSREGSAHAKRGDPSCRREVSMIQSETEATSAFFNIRGKGCEKNAEIQIL